MIITAIERRSRVYVYDENKNIIYSEPGELHGYTAYTCSIKRSKHIYTYNSKGELIFNGPCE